MDSALDRSRLNGTRLEDEINAFVKDFDRDTKVLHDHFDQHKSTSSDFESVLNRAARIDEFMRRQALNRRAQNDWAALRANLDELAQAYGDLALAIRVSEESLEFLECGRGTPSIFIAN